MGGVAVGEFWRLQLMLLATLLLSLSVGLLVSTLSREARDAMAATFSALLLLAGVFPAVYWLQLVVFRTSSARVWLLFSPVHTFVSALDDHYRTRIGAHEFWASLVLLLVLGLGFLTLAAVTLPHIWKDTGRQLVFGNSRWTSFAIAPSLHQSITPSLHHHPSSAENPYVLLLARRTSPQVWGWSAVWLLFGIWALFLGISVLWPPSGFPAPFVGALFSSYAVHQAVKVLMAGEATRELNEDRVSGALELLLVSPLTEQQIIAGHRLVFRQKCFRPIALLMLINLSMLLVVVTCGKTLRMGSNDQAVFAELFLGGMLMIFADFSAIGVVGAWRALCARKHHRAVLGTLGRVLGPPWAVLFLIVFFMHTVRTGGPGTAAAIFAFWFLVGILTDVIVISQARIGLSRGFKHWIC
jgi:hypothetical protein